MNPGGIRADLTYSQISGRELPGQVTYSEVDTDAFEAYFG